MNTEVRKTVCAAWAGKPIIYLEVGVFQGKTLKWMIKKVLTHKDSRAVGVDPWEAWSKFSTRRMQRIMNVLWAEVVPEKKGDLRCRLVPQTSADFLGGDYGLAHLLGISPLNVDICYLDGDANQTMLDALLSWPLLKAGGWMIFGGHDEDQLAKFLERKEGKFNTVFPNCIEKIGKGYSS
jgi:hypothetical protein